jgi:hypothetical protein
MKRAICGLSILAALALRVAVCFTKLMTTAAIGMMLGLSAQAQSPGTPRFEVVSVKRCTGADQPADARGGRKSGGPGPNSSPGRLSTGCQTAAGLVRQAYINYATGHLVRPSTDLFSLAPFLR